ncbi:Crp/Fnr family transcriptional regulator [Paracoccus marinaquae]|uniref:Crp/Fnr family transcriptional regulator n=1 Tax=Paracoccus marinaquae TaxID=2841926 RepID=A0ABS6AE37_9RHOB|nr:Crp/Fnr family transcriptional regulator [Paracoccus marinaquae]MBU3028868.1 Crp/Fnr family transcriptional regulator [Paracoccus marinaquae]
MNPGSAAEESAPEALLRQIRIKARADELWHLRDCPAGTQVLVQGVATPDLFVLQGGLVKLDYLTPDGRERIKSFIVDRGLFAIEDADLSFGARTLEPSQIVRLPIGWARAQLAQDMVLRQAYADFTDWLRLRKARREQLLLCASAEERYRLLCEHEPGLIRRLSQGDIARYLGITPVAFSRIKRRLRGG